MVRRARPEEREAVAAYIARRNADPASHIGYCGTQASEVAHALDTLWDEASWHTLFVVAEDGGRLVGVCGVDADRASGHGEVWGPFGEAAIADRLWPALLDLAPQDLTRFSLFAEVRNEAVLGFARTHGFEPRTGQWILSFAPSQLAGLPASPDLVEPDGAAVAALHDQLFPGTYYDGRELLKRQNAHRRLFAAQVAGRLVGYLYAEAEPAFGEGRIEFVGVTEAARGRGIGAQLLAEGLRWLFGFEGMGPITLCVGEDNPAAIGLYRKVGFGVTHHMAHFQFTR